TRPAGCRIGGPPRGWGSCRAAVDTKDLGHLRSLLPRCHAELEGFTSLDRSNTVAFEHAGVQKRISPAVRPLNKPEASLGLEPFDDRAHRRARRGFETRLAKTRGAAKFAEMGVIAVVVEIAAPGLTKIPVSDQVSFLSNRVTAHSDRGS